MAKKPCSPSRPPKPKRQPEARIDIVLPDGSRLSARGKAAEDLARKALAAPSAGWHQGPYGWWYGASYTGLNAAGTITTSSYTPAVYTAYAANSPIEDTKMAGAKIRSGTVSASTLTSASLPSNLSQGSISFTSADGKCGANGTAAVAAAEAALGAEPAKPAEPSA